MVRQKGKENRGTVLADGRITIPKKMREKLKIEYGMFYEVQEIDPDTVMIRFFRV
jgi:bifunctional DNA-binding transcriptional regulator/antitoxin component of YhaV-PrlF toxin-antitoxin module